MTGFNDEQIWLGTWGKVWVDGELLSEATAFRAEVTINYEDITRVQNLMTGHKMTALAGEGEITLSTLLEKLGVTEITLADVAAVSFTDPAYIEIEQLDSDWLLRSLAPFSTEEELVLAVGIPVDGLDPAADGGLERNAPDAFPSFLFQAEIQVRGLVEEVGGVGAAVVYLEGALRNHHDGVTLDGGDL